MKKFKNMMESYHTRNRACLHDLYTDKQIYYSSVSSSCQPVEDEKIFDYRTLSFQFTGTGFRTPEQMILHVWIPENVLSPENTRIPEDINMSENTLPPEADSRTTICSLFRTAYEDWLLRLLAAPVNALSESFQNDHKDTREKIFFAMQEPGPVVLTRNGCLHVKARQAFRLKIICRFPLMNGVLVHGKNSYKGIRTLLNLICDRLEAADLAALQKHVRLYSRQLQIRAFLKENGLLAFLADGSILPRQGTTQLPLPGAVPFQSPPSLRVTLHLRDGCVLTGMGLKCGVTLITGGGYSGKSTLLDCLEQGIYHHVSGDGREYLISDESAVKIYAEDGRYLSSTDLSPFFTWLPGNNDPRCFGTPHASGSVSQAAGIVEAVYGGSRCLLIDEDTSAANFMIRDETMRRLIKNEPIIPFTDRILELKEQGISTVLVIGGSGEYLKYADRVLLLEDYLVSDVTGQIHRIRPAGPGAAASPVPDARPGAAASPVTDARPGAATSPVPDAGPGAAASPVTDVPAAAASAASVPVTGTHSWMHRKVLPLSGESTDFSCGQCVQIEHARYLKIGGFTADITRLTALTESAQAGSLIWLLEKLLSREYSRNADLRDICEAAAETLFHDSLDTVPASRAHQYELWLEQIRSLDLILAACRLRPGTGPL